MRTNGHSRLLWRAIAGYGLRYSISNRGEVLSNPRRVWNGHQYYWVELQELKQTPDKDGYMQVGLCKDGKNKTLKVHRLVAQTFVPNPENKPEVNHENGRKSDNRAANLIWATKKENELHSRRVLGNHLGEKNSRSSLSNAQVVEIQSLIERGFDDQEIAQRMNDIVHRTTINRIRNKKIWTHL